eukprot:m.157467 g.157467  ORF g.157467 m.157467 type:complete len:369 (+) comp17005_c3_seq3:2150-3256(+)
MATAVARMQKVRERNASREQNENARFCHCHGSHSGLMVCCELCRNWYHGRCEKVTRNAIADGLRFLCSSCRKTRRPPASAVRALLHTIAQSPVALPEQALIANLLALNDAWVADATAVLEGRRPEITVAEADELQLRGDLLELTNGDLAEQLHYHLHPEDRPKPKPKPQSESGSDSDGNDDDDDGGDEGASAQKKKKARTDEEEVFCICRKPFDGKAFMIQCETCDEWYHGSCVGVTKKQAKDIEAYKCARCLQPPAPHQQDSTTMPQHPTGSSGQQSLHALLAAAAAAVMGAMSTGSFTPQTQAQAQAGQADSAAVPQQQPVPQTPLQVQAQAPAPAAPELMLVDAQGSVAAGAFLSALPASHLDSP